MKETEQARRDRRIVEANDGVIEAPYIIGFNIGYDDWPVWDNPFIDDGYSQYRGYESGFDCHRSQALRTEDWQGG